MLLFSKFQNNAIFWESLWTSVKWVILGCWKNRSQNSWALCQCWFFWKTNFEVVGGSQHCVCKKGTVRPQGTPRCVPEPLLQQYLNNIIGNCTEIQHELIEVYGPRISFHTESSYGSYAANSVHRTIERKEEVCDPAKSKPCKGWHIVCLVKSAQLWTIISIINAFGEGTEWLSK